MVTPMLQVNRRQKPSTLMKAIVHRTGRSTGTSSSVVCWTVCKLDKTTTNTWGYIRIELLYQQLFDQPCYRRYTSFKVLSSLSCSEELSSSEEDACCCAASSPSVTVTVWAGETVSVLVVVASAADEPSLQSNPRSFTVNMAIRASVRLLLPFFMKVRCVSTHVPSDCFSLYTCGTLQCPIAFCVPSAQCSVWFITYRRVFGVCLQALVLDESKFSCKCSIRNAESRLDRID